MAKAKSGKSAPLVRSVVVDGQTIPYLLTRKRVKNLNLRVRSDGSVAVSAPVSVSDAAISAFVERHAEFLSAALRRVRERQAARQGELLFRDGDRISVFGRDVTVRVERGSAARAFFDASSGVLFLVLPDPDDASRRRALAAAWGKRHLEQAIRPICDRASRDFAPLGVSPSSVRFRSMVSRWGSCHTGKKSITLNYALIGVPLPLVEYVVYHEFAHLIHPNHSPAFHAQVAAFLPDWKSRRAALKQSHCRFF